MIVFEDWFSSYDKYLVAEYQKHGTEDFLLADLPETDKPLVVPWVYTKNAKNPQEAKEKFLNDLFDFEKYDIEKYKKNDKKLVTIRHPIRNFVAPFDMPLTKKAALNALKEMAGQADAKYCHIVKQAMKMDEAGIPITDGIKFSEAASKKYGKMLMRENVIAFFDDANDVRLKVCRFMQGVKPGQVLSNNISVGQIVNSVKKRIVDSETAAGKYLNQGYKMAVMVGLLSFGVWGTKQMLHNGEPKEAQTELQGAADGKKISIVDAVTGSSEIKAELEQAASKDMVVAADRTAVATTEPAEIAKVSVDTLKRVDKYGNVARIKALMPEISALLISVEGYAQRAFNEGGKTPTIGYGTTFHIDENGKTSKVKLSEKTTPYKAFQDKWRYIDKYMVDIFNDNIKRMCSDAELCAGIGAGFCWGPSALETSDFFKAMRMRANYSVQGRKLSGFRKQKGLLKREFILASLLDGNLAVHDLLKLPIYLDSRYNEFVDCSIYHLRLRDIMVCKKDKKGNFLQDKNGNDIPVISKDGFGTFYTKKARSLINMLAKQTQYTNKRYKTVETLMSPQLCNKLKAKAVAERQTTVNQAVYDKQREKKSR